MKFSIVSKEDDYLNNALFWVSKSKDARKKRWINVFVRAALFLVVAFNAYMHDNLYLAGFSVIAAIALVFLYPIYQRSFYKKSYLKYIKTIYKERIGQPCEIEFTADQLITTDPTGTSEMALDTLDEIYETGAYFYLKFETGEALFLPKDQIEESDFLAVRDTLVAKYKVPFTQDLNWVWK